MAPDSPPLRKRSRFVTVLGWFCAIVGTYSVPVRLLQITGVFAAKNLASIYLIYLLAAVLLLVVGIGLIRRRWWALPFGVALLFFGGVRQSIALYLTLSGYFSAQPGVEPEFARAAVPILSTVYVASLAWLVFLVWKFRRPAIRAEFRR
jgi:hypothetical protein